MTDEPVVFSALETVAFTPPDSPRSYVLSPLSYRQRTAMFRELRRVGGVQVDNAAGLDALRSAVRDVSPSNADELLAAIDQAEAAPDDLAAQARLAAIDVAMVDVPVSQAMRDARARWNEAVPWVAARHGLRGWSGPGLPPFQAEAGLVPEALLDAIPGAELAAAGGRAYLLAVVGRSAEGNSAAPSPAPETPKDSPED